MNLLKLSISKDALAERFQVHGLVGDDNITLLPYDRADADNIRVALAYVLRPFQSFQHQGQQCKAIATATKGTKGLDIWVHIQTRGTKSVEYTPQPLCQVVGKNGAYAVEINQAVAAEYPEVMRVIGSAATLLEFGQDYYFEADVRKLAQGLLADHCLPFWPGIFLALTQEDAAACALVENIFAHLLHGCGKITRISMDNTPANRQALGRELAEGFNAALAKLEERLAYPGPMVAAIAREFEALTARIATAEALLEVELDCLEAQVAVELALSAAV